MTDEHSQLSLLLYVWIGKSHDYHVTLFTFICVERLRASCISNLFLIIVASNFFSNSSKSIYALDSGTKSRT